MPGHAELKLRDKKNSFAFKVIKALFHPLLGIRVLPFKF